MRMQLSKTAAKKLRKKERETNLHTDKLESDSDNPVDSISNGSIVSPVSTSSPPATAAISMDTLSRQLDSPPIPISVTPSTIQTTTPVFIPPPGPAGDLLAMLMSSSDTSSSSRGNGHHSPSSTSHLSTHSLPKSIYTPPIIPSIDQQSSSYFKSKSGFSIRL